MNLNYLTEKSHLGPENFIAKPMDPDTLEKRVAQFCEVRRKLKEEQ